MAITTTISKPLESGYVQVDAKYKSGYSRYYKVPKSKARDFSYELKHNDKAMTWYSNAAFVIALLTGTFGAAYFTRKMESRFKQFLIETASAIGLVTLSYLGVNEYAKSKENDILTKHHAKEIFYKA